MDEHLNTGRGDIEFEPPRYESTGNRLICARRFDSGENCPNVPTHHVLWNSRCDNGLCCSKHVAEAKSKWVTYAVHEIESPCMVEGSLFYEDFNRCLFKEEA